MPPTVRKDSRRPFVLPADPMSDQHIHAAIRAAQAGDKAAFESLLRGHYQSMYKMAYHWCGDRETAQDVVQDACIKVARRIDGFRFRASFSSWLYRIVVNTARDHHRQHRRRRADALPDNDAPAAPSAAPNADDQLHARQVLRRVQSLPEREKTAVLLVFAHGMSHKEAAFSMQCKESTVSGYIHRARKKLAAFAAGEVVHG